MNQVKKILITGATGLVGSYVARLLHSKGKYQLVAVKRPSSVLHLVNEIKDEIEWVEGDLIDPFFCAEVVRDVDTVIHCAGFISFQPKYYEKMIAVNHRSTSALIHASLEQKVSHFIHVSSIAALGRSEEIETIDETAIWRRSQYNSDYAISKYLGEMEVWKGAAEGLQVAVINPAVILGAGLWGNGSLSVYDKVWRNLPFYPKGATGWVDVRDVAQSILQIMELQAYGKRYIISGMNLSFREVISQMANTLQKKSPTRPISRWMAELAWRGSSILSTLTGKEPFVEKATVRLSQNKYTYPNLRSIEDLKMDYRDLNQTIKESSLAYLNSKNQKSKFAILPF